MAEMESRPQGWMGRIKSRLKLDIDESVTWFLLVFVYMVGFTFDEVKFEFSGIFPIPSTSLMILIVILFCLVMSVMLLIEPLLPPKLHTWVKSGRISYPVQYLRGLSILIAFIVGWPAGLNILGDKLADLWWVRTVIVFTGIGISLVLLVRVALVPWLSHKLRQPE